MNSVANCHLTALPCSGSFVATIVSLSQDALDALSRVHNTVSVTLKLHLARGAKLQLAQLWPGDDSWRPLAFARRTDGVQCTVVLKRGSVMLRLRAV